MSVQYLKAIGRYFNFWLSRTNLFKGNSWKLEKILETRMLQDMRDLPGHWDMRSGNARKKRHEERGGKQFSARQSHRWWQPRRKSPQSSHWKLKQFHTHLFHNCAFVNGAFIISPFFLSLANGIEKLVMHRTIMSPQMLASSLPYWWNHLRTRSP